MALPRIRHDALFRLLVSDPGRAAALLVDYLPSAVRERLDTDYPPELMEGTAVDGEGKVTQADAIFRARLKDGASVWVYVLLEHKSKPDVRTPLQLMRYILRLWFAYLDRGEGPPGRLPLIIPVVFFNGREPWTLSCSIAEMIDAPAGLEHLARAVGAFTLHDLSGIALEELPRDVGVRGALLGLARAFFKDIAKEIPDFEVDAMVVAAAADTDFGQYMLLYLLEQVDIPPARIEASMRRIGAGPEEVEALMGTATRIWFKEGRDQGRVEGKAEGKAETLARLLARRFGRPLAEVQARLAGADFKQLDRWLDAVLEAPTFEAVFGSRPRR